MPLHHFQLPSRDTGKFLRLFCAASNNEKVELQNKVDGVDGYMYKIEEDVMANGTFNANNTCFNPYPDLLVDLPVDCTSEVDCTDNPSVFHPLDGAVNHFLPNGLLNTTTCTAATPRTRCYRRYI